MNPRSASLFNSNRADMSLSCPLAVRQLSASQSAIESRRRRIAQELRHCLDLATIALDVQNLHKRFGEKLVHCGPVGSGDALGQPWIVRIRHDQGDGGFLDLHHTLEASMTLPAVRYKAAGTSI